MCKQIFFGNSFSEYVLLELKLQGHSVINILTFYRSPNSSADNNDKLCTLINDVSSRQGYKLIVGDFNLPYTLTGKVAIHRML